MLDAQGGRPAVEVAHLARSKLGRADGETRLARIDQREVDQFGQRLFKRFGRIITGPVGAERNFRAGMRHQVGLEEARQAV